MDLDLRKVRYFVAVAEELNFGRAAERVHIAQPVLSRQIRALEKELHAQLFVRDSSGTQLTPAGVQLLADASLLLAKALIRNPALYRSPQGKAPPPLDLLGRAAHCRSCCPVSRVACSGSLSS